MWVFSFLVRVRKDGIECIFAYILSTRASGSVKKSNECLAENCPRAEHQRLDRERNPTEHQVDDLQGDHVNDLQGDQVNDLQGDQVNDLQGDQVNDLQGDQVNDLSVRERGPVEDLSKRR